ncbi:glycosyltransferase [Polluticoccus soli]|uniref:glycosyltransferase n=1 Tax=Polluticoccus soli TaxID=3034150 RepID=UPI0023E229D6|nr:glycosyltransferase [Flavipsychrobacter sp. JY13-12]
MSFSHLLIVTPGFAANEEDTTSVPAVQQFLLSFRKIFPDIVLSLISFHYPCRNDSYDWHGIDVHTIGNKHAGGLKKLFSFYRFLKIGKKINSKVPIDGVLCFWLTDSTLAAKLLARKLNVPSFVWMHGQDAKADNKYVRIVRPSMEHLAAISEPQSRLFERNFGQRPGHIVSNGVDPCIFPPLNAGNRQTDLLSVGSLIPLKQQHLFIELVRDLRDTGYLHIKAMLVGEGKLQQELEDLVKKYGLEDMLCLKGRLQHNEVLNEMNNARILVHPSSYEGHSTVMLEALYSGCQVVSFLPAGQGSIDNFTMCEDFEEMKRVSRKLLSAHNSCERIEVNRIETSVLQVKRIFDQLKLK